MEPIRVFIGYDSHEAVSFHVASQSLHRHSSRPVSVTPVMLSQLRGVFQRTRDPNQSTEFSFSRFLVPYLCSYQGWALYVDCDVLFCSDVAELWDLRDNGCAVQVVKHDHRPHESTKFRGNVQTSYPRKNWSSVMLLNCQRCTSLTPDYVSRASGLELHRFQWLDNNELIGALPRKWNHLVDYDDRSAGEPACLHYTSGGPWFEDCRDSGFAAVWWAELQQACHPVAGQERLRVPEAPTSGANT